MQTLKQMFNPAVWRRWAMVFLAGVVLLVSTACGATQAAVPVNSQPPQADAMYPHTDTTRDTSAADAKADRMIRQAEQRIQQGKDKSLGQQVEDVGESAQQAAKNIGQSTQRAAENAADNALDMVDDAAKAID